MWTLKDNFHFSARPCIILYVIYTNVFVIPYYINVPRFLCRELVSEIRPPLKQLGIKLRRDCEILYIIIAVK